MAKAKLLDFVVTYMTESGEEDVAELSAYSFSQADMLARQTYKTVMAVEYVGICVD